MDNFSYKKILDESPVGYALHRIILDNEGVPCDYEYIDANKQFEKFTGLKIENVLGKRVTEVIPEIRKSSFNWIEFYGNIAMNGGSEELEEFCKSLKRWYKIRACSFGENCFITYFTEISTEKRKEYLFDTALEGFKYPFCIIDVENYNVEYGNSVSGFVPGEKTTCYKLTHLSDEPCSGEEHICPIQKIKQTKQPVKVEHIHFNSKGEKIYVEVNAFPIFDEEGNLDKIIEYSVDITDSKILQLILMQNEEKFRNLFDNMTEMVVLNEIVIEEDKTIDYKIIDCNKAYLSVSEYKKDEVIGKLGSDLDKDFLFSQLDNYERVIKTKEPFYFDIYNPKWDKYFMVSIVSIKNNQFAVIAKDVTEMKQYENTISNKNYEMEKYLYIASHDLSKRIITDTLSLKKNIANLNYNWQCSLVFLDIHLLDNLSDHGIY